MKMDRDLLAKGLVERGVTAEHCLFEKRVQDLNCAPILAKLLALSGDVDVVICIHPLGHRELVEDSSPNACSRQFHGVQSGLREASLSVNVPMKLHACLYPFAQDIRERGIQRTLDDVMLLSSAHQEAIRPKPAKGMGFDFDS